MSTALWFLLLLLPAFGIIYAVWSFKSKTAAKEASSRERMTLLVGVTQAARAPDAVSGKVSPQRVTELRTVPGEERTQARRFLSEPETLAYYLLKAGLPRYEVFPRVSLAAVLRTSASLSSVAAPVNGRQNLDFAICDKTMKVVAAVQLEGRESAEAMAALERELNTAGIRLIRFDPAALPRREQVRARVFGESR